MPSKSKAQQRFFGMVDAYKKGELKKASSKIKKAANGMSMNDVKDFAETKHKGLPEKVKEQAIIRLTESDLHRIVKESVNRILNESFVSKKLEAIAKQHGGIETSGGHAWAWVHNKRVPISQITDDMIADEAVNKDLNSGIYFKDGTVLPFTNIDAVRNLTNTFKDNAKAMGRYSSDIADREHVPTTERGKQLKNIRKSLDWANTVASYDEKPSNRDMKRSWKEYSNRVRPHINDVYGGYRKGFDKSDLTSYGYA